MSKVNCMRIISSVYLLIKQTNKNKKQRLLQGCNKKNKKENGYMAFMLKMKKINLVSNDFTKYFLCFISNFSMFFLALSSLLYYSYFNFQSFYYLSKNTNFLHCYTPQFEYVILLINYGLSGINAKTIVKILSILSTNLIFDFW